MPNPNAIVSTTIRFEPSLDRMEAEQLPEVLSVELEGGRRVRLDPGDPRSAGFARVLDGLSKQGMPVYVEVDPATDAITKLHIPLVTRVVGLVARDEALLVELDASHAVHLLRRGEPDADELERQLRDAMQMGRPVVVTTDDAHNVIDVRFAPERDWR